MSARQALIGAGANLGDRAAALRDAAAKIAAIPGVEAIEVSPCYETDPVGITEQPRFLNAVIGIETTLGPEALLAGLQQIEHAAGRIRELRWGPRTLDLDLLLFEGEMRSSPALQLPHPRMLERTFVTFPLRDLLASRRFQRPCWDELRRTLEALPSTTPGVARVQPSDPNG